MFGEAQRPRSSNSGDREKVAVRDTVTLEEKKYVQNHKEPPRLPLKIEGTYITSEHSYQKPQSFGQDCKSLADPGSSDDDDVSSFEEEQEFRMGDKNRLKFSAKEHRMPEKNPAEGNVVFVYNDKKGSEDPRDSHLQWQLNLLTHIENVQNEVTSRMDRIEKKLMFWKAGLISQGNWSHQTLWQDYPSLNAT